WILSTLSAPLEFLPSPGGGSGRDWDQSAPPKFPVRRHLPPTPPPQWMQGLFQATGTPIPGPELCACHSSNQFPSTVWVAPENFSTNSSVAPDFCMRPINSLASRI